MDLIKIEKDCERARSLFKLSMLRYKKLNNFDISEESSLIAESYYEICKELITALLFIDGYKTLSHKDLVSYIKENYKNEFDFSEIETLDILRKRRNKIVYYGVFVDENYIERNKKIFESLIKKIKNIIEGKLK